MATDGGWGKPGGSPRASPLEGAGPGEEPPTCSSTRRSWTWGRATGIGHPRGAEARLFCPWDSPGRNTGVGCHALLQGRFPTRDRTHVSCGSCIAGGFFTSEPQGSPEG